MEGFLGGDLGGVDGRMKNYISKLLAGWGCRAFSA